MILLRAAGIPARLAVGYSQGERVENTFLVKLNDAHAWPEVYYPEVGWLPYEPTVIEIEPQYSLPAQDGNQDVNDGLSPEERRGNQGEAPQPEPNMGEPEAENGQVTPARWITYILIAILVILILVGLWLVIGRRYWKKPPRLSSILLKWLRFLHIPIPRWLTWWDWYTGLSDIAVRYYWIEKLAVNTGFVSITPSTPSDLLTALAVALPESRPDIDLFHQGLYRELYSRDKVYSRQECRAAGAALQRDLVSGIIDKLLHRRTV